MAIEQEYMSAKRANELRYAQAMQIYDEIIRRYQPGGTFGQAALGQLEKQKVRDVGRETQQMISSGLYGTTTTAGLPGKWEAEVGAPTRLRLEDIMMERLSQAQIGKAGFIERREDVYPDVGAYAEQTAVDAPTFTRTYEEGPSPWEAGFMGGGFTLSGADPFAGGTTPRTGGTGGAVYGSGTREATMAERERRKKAAATVGQATTTPTYGQAQPSQQIGMTGGTGVQTIYKQETKGGEQVMGIYKGNRRVGSYTMAQYAALGK